MRRLFRATVSSLPLQLLMTVPALADTGGERTGFWHMNDWSWGHMMFGGSLMMILFWGAIILIAFLIFSRVRPGRDNPPRPSKTPREILEERFASGEIDEEEFDRRRRKIDKEQG